MRVYIEAYGCTLNRGEASEFTRHISNQGHLVVQDPAEADAYAIFTCGVIQATENHMLRRIGELASQDKQLLVCGCLVNINKDAIQKFAPGACLFKPAEQHKAAEYLGNVGAPTPSTDSESAIGILPMATGCIGLCTYCITRHARGSLQSRPVKELEARLQELVSLGKAEIQLCAQDSAIYGQDLGTNLNELVGQLESVPGDFMMRIGMMNPANVMKSLDSLLEAFESPKVFKFLHLPVQSGSQRVLDSMNRGHGPGDFLEIVEAFRSRFPDMVLSTDIIVGFPGESDAEFQESVQLIKDTKPDIINITRFSPRPGTPAHGMGNQVHGRSVKARSRQLTELKFGMTEGLQDRFEGIEIRALATERRAAGTTFLRSRDYRPIVVQGEHELGRWYNIKITGSEPTHLLGLLDNNV